MPLNSVDRLYKIYLEVKRTFENLQREIHLIHSFHKKIFFQRFGVSCLFWFPLAIMNTRSTS